MLNIYIAPRNAFLSCQCLDISRTNVDLSFSLAPSETFVCPMQRPVGAKSFPEPKLITCHLIITQGTISIAVYVPI